jgi:hypothetical protein
MAGDGGPVITAPSLGLEVGYALRVLGDSLLFGEPATPSPECARAPSEKQGRIGEVQRYVITIKGRNFEDVDSAELVAPPEPGETIETSLGQCIVISADPPDEGSAVGKIVCRLP